MKITLEQGGESITTTCAGTSQHRHDRRVIHGLSKRGYAWIESRPYGETVITETRLGTMRLDYVSGDPIP